MVEPCWSDLKNESHSPWHNMSDANLAAKAVACDIIVTGLRRIEEVIVIMFEGTKDVYRT